MVSPATIKQAFLQYDILREGVEKFALSISKKGLLEKCPELEEDLLELGKSIKEAESVLWRKDAN